MPGGRERRAREGEDIRMGKTVLIGNPFGTFRPWTGFLGAAGVLVAVVLGGAVSKVSGGCAIALTASLLAYFNLRKPRKNEADSSAVWAGVLHFFVTMSGAATWASVTFATRAAAVVQESAQQASVTADVMQDFAMASGFVGGMLALFRSTRTNAYSLATLNELQSIRDQVRRRDQLLELSSEAALAESAEGVLAIISRMVEEAVDSSAMHPDGGALSVWFAGPARWEIIASKGLSEATRDKFVQDLIAVETPGAGVVANMAALGRNRFVDGDVARHPWFRDDPDRVGVTASLAAVLLLETGTRKPIGAVCFTSDKQVTDGMAVQRVLLMWEIAFTLPLTNLARWARNTE